MPGDGVCFLRVFKQGRDMWKKRLRDNYNGDALAWAAFDNTYGLAARLGYASAAEAWADNPMIQGSTNPADFKRVRERVDINAILARPANNGSSRYGAQMGRRNRVGDDPEKLYLQRMRFVGGDYDTGGAYWGSGHEAMWCAFSPNLTTAVFFRAHNRQEAREKVIDLLGGGWNFYR